MPIYDYVCDAGHRFERIVPLATFNAPQTCECGACATKQVAAPRIISDCIDPRYGSDGKLHDSKQSWEASLKAAGHTILRKGETIKPAQRDAKADKAKRRESIKAAIQDVKYGRVPPPPPPGPVTGAYNV